MIAEVLHCIFSNASRFAQTGGCITVAPRPAPRGFVLTIVDDGPGMSDLEILRATEPSPAWVAGAPGAPASASLPVAGRLMELHGGRLTIEATPGAGCTVALAFPEERMG